MSSRDTEEKQGFCVLFCRVVLFSVALAAITLSIIVGLRCDFLSFSQDSEQSAPSPYNSTGNSTGVFTLGLIRWDPDESGCRSLPENWHDLSPESRAAATAAGVAILLAAFSILLLWSECVLCRFCGARFLESTSFVIAGLGQAATFLLFSSDICTSNLHLPYPCRIGFAGHLSIVSTFLYLICAVLVCATRKPEPLCLDFKRKERKDPWCPCCRKAKKSESDDSAQEKGTDEAQRNASQTQVTEPQPVLEPQPPAEPPTAAAVVVATYPEEGVSERYEDSKKSNHSGRSLYKQASSYFWSSTKKADEDSHYSAGTRATLPSYRDVAFIDDEAFFDVEG